MAMRRPGLGNNTYTPRADGEKVDYSDQNHRLFSKRNVIMRRIDDLREVEETERSREERRELSRLVHDLDSITYEIIQANYGLVRNYTKKFTSNSSREDTDDFEAAAVVGLMRAIDTFDPDKGTFGQWAYKPIQREVLRAVRDAEYKTMNPGDFERRPDVLRAVAALVAEFDRPPTNAEVAAKAGVTVDQVRRILEAPRLDSLSARVGEDGDTSLVDLIPDGETAVDAEVMTNMLLASLEKYGLTALDKRELFVLVRRFGLDAEPEQNLATIGEVLGLSREAVRQVEAKALAKIQHPVIMRRIYRNGRV